MLEEKYETMVNNVAKECETKVMNHFKLSNFVFEFKLNNVLDEQDAGELE